MRFSGTHAGRQSSAVWLVLVAGLICALILAVALFRAGSAQASPRAALVVTSAADSGPGSLRAALQLAADGDTISFNLPSGSTITLTQQLTVTSTILIDGSSAPGLRISGNRVTRVISASAPLAIQSLTIADGKSAGDGAGVSSTADLTLTDVLLTNNRSEGSGGALYVTTDTAVLLSNTDLISNSALLRAGGASIRGALVISGGLFERNQCTQDFPIYCSGGGLVSYQTAIMTGTEFLSNSATLHGGGMNVFHLSMTDTVLRGNQSGYNGGGAYVRGGGTLVTRGLIEHNSAEVCGGGMFIIGSSRFEDSEVRLNTSGSFGGGIYAGYGGGAFNGATVEVSATEFLTNTSGKGGGGLLIDGPVSRASVADSLFEANTAAFAGGGLMSSGSWVLVASTDFISNTAFGTEFSGDLETGYGGGFFNDSYGDAQVENSLFTRNMASNKGGGIGSKGPITVTNTLLTQNTIITDTFDHQPYFEDSPPAGAGLYSGHETIVEASRFEENSCINTCRGGGIAVAWELSLRGTELISNTAGFGGGLHKGLNGDFSVDASSFAGNHALRDGGAIGVLTEPWFYSADGTISATRFIANSAGRNGGALSTGRLTGSQSSRTTVQNAIFARNSATGKGAALYFNSSDGAMVRHATIASPSMLSGAAIYVDKGAVSIDNTIIMAHGVGIRAAQKGTIKEDHNLFFGNTLRRQSASPGQITGGLQDLSADPALVDVALDDYHLSAGSPVLDRGRNLGLLSDLDGAPRFVNFGVDIGAYEHQTPRPAFRTYLPLTRA